MDILAVLRALVDVQESLEITDPVRDRVRKAHKMVPPTGDPLPDTPCFMNTWSLIEEARRSSLRHQHYQVNMQLAVENADRDVAAEIATAFHIALVEALDQNTTLAQTVSSQKLRGQDPTLVAFNFGGIIYTGLDLVLDVFLDEGATFAP
jgi:hypothetical protein